MAFENQPRRSAFEFVSGSFRVTFLSDKRTGDAGVIETPGLPKSEFESRRWSARSSTVSCVRNTPERKPFQSARVLFTGLFSLVIARDVATPIVMSFADSGTVVLHVPTSISASVGDEPIRQSKLLEVYFARPTRWSKSSKRGSERRGSRQGSILR
jgi:hypothetical protein